MGMHSHQSAVLTWFQRTRNGWQNFWESVCCVFSFLLALVVSWDKAEEERRQATVKWKIHAELAELSKLSGCKKLDATVCKKLERMQTLLRELKQDSTCATSSPTSNSSFASDMSPASSLSSSRRYSTDKFCSQDTTVLKRSSSLGTGTSVGHSSNSVSRLIHRQSFHHNVSAQRESFPRKSDVRLDHLRFHEHSSSPWKLPNASRRDGPNDCGSPMNPESRQSPNFAHAPPQLLRHHSACAVTPKFVTPSRKQAELQDSVQERVSALLSASRHNRFSVVEDILQDASHVNASDEYGNTVLMLACQNGNKRIAKLCLRKGAQINAKNEKGLSALDFCRMFKYTKLMEYLIEKGGLFGKESLAPEEQSPICVNDSISPSQYSISAHIGSSPSCIASNLQFQLESPSGNKVQALRRDLYADCFSELQDVPEHAQEYGGMQFADGDCWTATKESTTSWNDDDCASMASTWVIEKQAGSGNVA